MDDIISTEELLNHIGRRINSVRKASKLTQIEFARSLGVKQADISGLENGLTAPSERLIISICQLYSMNKEWLKSGKGEFSSRVPVRKHSKKFWLPPRPPVILMNVIKDRPEVALQDCYAASLLKGEIATTRPETSSPLHPAPIYAIRTGDGGCAVKRLYKSDNGLIIGSDNIRKYAPQNAWSQNLNELIIGRVAWGWRNLQEM